MENRKAIWYSIIRYSPDDISGEVVNVGLVLHGTEDDDNLRYSILDGNSPKLRSISNSKVDFQVYKSYKDVLEYYLEECTKDLIGSVGGVTVGSSYSTDFLENLYLENKDKKLTITKPNFAFTQNADLLFKTLFSTYIGSQYIKDEPKTVTAKKFIKNLFEKRNLLEKKIKMDLEFNPIESLSDLKIKIDFGFKNGAWNYIETLPNLKAPQETSEWFAKTRFTIETLKSKDETANLRLLYKASDFVENRGIYSMINYLAENNSKVIKLDIEEPNIINELCDYIEENAEDIDEHMAS